MACEPCVCRALSMRWFSSMHRFPFAVVGKYFASSGSQGLYMATLNVFIVIPQLLDTAYTGSVTRRWSESVVMLTGGVWAVLAALATGVGLVLLDDGVGELVGASCARARAPLGVYVPELCLTSLHCVCSSGIRGDSSSVWFPARVPLLVRAVCVSASSQGGLCVCRSPPVVPHSASPCEGHCQATVQVCAQRRVPWLASLGTEHVMHSREASSSTSTSSMCFGR